MYGEMFNRPDIDLSSIVKLGLQEKLQNLYPLIERENYEKD
tara:strand:+ start:203 stop:325 length:123 start_codon:yes stop_codon:yes gene_type:complete